MGRSPTINVRHIDRLVVEGKSSAANDGHQHEGMSLSAEQPTSLPSTMSQFPARRHIPRFISPREIGAEQEGHQDRAAEAGPDLGGRRGFNAPAISENLFLAPTAGRKRAHRQLIPLGYARP